MEPRSFDSELLAYSFQPSLLTCSFIFHPGLTFQEVTFHSALLFHCMSTFYLAKDNLWLNQPGSNKAKRGGNQISKSCWTPPEGQEPTLWNWWRRPWSHGGCNPCHGARTGPVVSYTLQDEKRLICLKWSQFHRSAFRSIFSVSTVWLSSVGEICGSNSARCCQRTVHTVVRCSGSTSVTKGRF